MEPLRLFFLGTPRIERAGQVLAIDTRKATALLAYLVLTGEWQTRDALAALLWPDFDHKRSKAALRRTLSALKSAIGGAALHITRDGIGVEMAQVWCDVDQFQQLLVHKPDVAQLTTAVALYRGDFLAGFSLRDSIPFDNWQLFTAQNLRRDLENGLEKLINHHLAQQAYSQALPLARRWLALDPLREEVHRTLMQLYAWQGQPNAALRQYRDCVRILDTELGVPPLPETSTLYESIQNDRLTTPPLAEKISAAPNTTLSQQSATPLPLIGRTTELAQMEAIYQQVGPNGRFLAIEGETGIGKTRLAESFLDQLRLQGALVFSARCYAGESNLAYAPLIQMLRENINQPQTAARLATVSPTILAEAARLLPEITRFQNEKLTAPALDAPGAQSRFFTGVGQLLTILLAGPKPGVLWLDDAHWLDAASLDLLLFWARRWQQRPTLILLAWRAEDLTANHPLHQLTAALRRDGVGDLIQLTRFTAQEVAQMVAAENNAFNGDLSDRLYAETEGLPYFVVAYLVELHQQPLLFASAAPWNIPRTVADLLHNRLTHVGETERQLLQTAAVIGHAFSFDLVQTASGRSEEEALSSLENLVLRGILQEATAVYNFTHEKLRALVYEETSLARRRLLHRRLAETLTQQAAQQPQPTDWAGQIARHYHLAGHDAQAADLFKKAGDHARSLFAHQDALAHYQMALALGNDETAVLHEAAADLFTRLGEYTKALNRYETAVTLADEGDQGRLEHKLSRVYQRQGKWLLAEQRLAQAWQHYGPTPATAVAVQLYSDGSLIAYRQNQSEQAQTLAQKALALVQTSTGTPAKAQVHNMLGILARSQGDYATAADHHYQSRRLADATDQLDAQIAARNNLALTLRTAGQIDDAHQQLQQALTLCQTYGDRHHEAALRNNLADLYHEAGDEEAAMVQLKQAVTIFAEIGYEQNVWQAEVWKLTEW